MFESHRGRQAPRIGRPPPAGWADSPRERNPTGMLRLCVLTVTIAVVTILLLPLQALSVACAWRTRRAIPRLYHRLLCRLLGVRIRCIGSPARQRPLLIVANHVSWIDIPVITAVVPVVFVAKREVGEWPVIGTLAKLQRSVFVDRERRHRTGDAAADMARRLLDRDPVVLFGEGTSSDGNRVLPFRSALVGAAERLLETADSDAVTVQPLSIAYVGLQGLPIGRQHRPAVAWYGALDLFPHLANVLRHGAIDVVLSWGEPLVYDHATDRKQLTRIMETRVRRLTSSALRGHARTDRANAS
jgi:1-acyl-sn-glycerol-3-phosphate acyltransferase